MQNSSNNNSNSNYVNAHNTIQNMYKQQDAELDNLQEMDAEDLAQRFCVTLAHAKCLEMLIAVLRQPAGAEYVENMLDIANEYYWTLFEDTNAALEDYKLFVENM